MAGDDGQPAWRRELKKALHAAEAGRRLDALRELDRLWRTQPEHLAAIAPLYGQLLFEEGDLRAAEVVLTRALTLNSVAGLESVLVRLLLRQQRAWAAAERLEAALLRYAVTPAGPLAAAGHDVCVQEGRGIHGWVGRSSNLWLVGEAFAPTGIAVVRVEGIGANWAVEKTVRSRGSEGAAFRIPAPRHRSPCRVLIDGNSLLGGLLPAVPDFGFDGRAVTSGSMVTGWVRLGWNPDSVPSLVVEDEIDGRLQVPTKPDAGGTGRHLFSFDSRRLRGTRLSISAVLPDGSRPCLPDAPLIVDRAIAPVARAGSMGKPRSRTKPPGRDVRTLVDVIIPVYLGEEETRACLRSALATIGAEGAIIVVDDASPSAALRSELDRLAAEGLIHLLRNETNLGFVGAVNRAMGVHPDRDIVLLNSDAIVHGDWLLRLRQAAYRAQDVGTVTPWTNDGTIVSYPEHPQRPLDFDTAASLDDLAARQFGGQSVDLPVGVGFCLYIRRACLAEIGAFDEATFGVGYGEEVDFCMRARARGWRHVLAADTFVLHAGGRSFGARRAALLERSGRLLELRHPGYERWIARYLRTASLAPLRRQLDEAQLFAIPGPFALVVTLALTGGVDRFVADRCRQLRARGLVPLVLRPVGNDAARCMIHLQDSSLQALRYEVPTGLPALRTLLGRLPVEHTEIHHFLDLDPRVIEAVRSLPAPYDVYIHDYVWICPQITLMDQRRRYCGEPAVAVCERCLARNGSALDPSMPVAELRRRSGRWLSAAQRVIVPTKDVAGRLLRYFPSLRTHVQPWEPVESGSLIHQPESSLIRVLILGAIGDPKGFEVLLKCARDAVARNLPLEFVVIGYTRNDRLLLETGKVFVTGRYVDAEVPHLILRERPHLAFLPSVWPETWSYVLTHVLRAGLPVVAFDLGGIAERLREAGTGELIPLDTGPALINAHLLRVAAAAPTEDDRSIVDGTPRRGASHRTPAATS